MFVPFAVYMCVVMQKNYWSASKKSKAYHNSGCHKVPEHASGARRKLARLVGREGGKKEKKEKEILILSEGAK